MNTTRLLPLETRWNTASIPAVKEDLESMNAKNFEKMAHGDIVGFKNLAFDYFNDTRRLMTGWLSMIDAGEFSNLRMELHRCKGGASLFGLERLVALIGNRESPNKLEEEGFDLAEFEKELSAAEQAVMGMVETVS